MYLVRVRVSYARSLTVYAVYNPVRANTSNISTANISSTASNRKPPLHFRNVKRRIGFYLPSRQTGSHSLFGLIALNG